MMDISDINTIININNAIKEGKYDEHFNELALDILHTRSIDEVFAAHTQEEPLLTVLSQKYIHSNG